MFILVFIASVFQRCSSPTNYGPPCVYVTPYITKKIPCPSWPSICKSTFTFTSLQRPPAYTNKDAGSTLKQGTSVGVENSLSASEPSGMCSIFSFPCRHLLPFIWSWERCSFISSYFPAQSHSTNPVNTLSSAYYASNRDRSDPSDMPGFRGS